MAIYWTMGVDCGEDRALAERFVRHFEGHSIALPEGAPLICTSHAETHRGIHFVRVYPRGMGLATLPEDERRPELANDHTESLVRDALYSELRSLPGFRRAMFGGECFGQMAFATPEEDSDIDYGNMISSISAFPDSPPDRTSEPFSDGYRIVTAMRAEGDGPPSADVAASISENMQKLRSKDAADRESAAEALYRLGPAARAAVPALLDALIVEPDACAWIGTAIVELRASKDDITKLGVALRSPNSHARFWAARACVKLGTSAHPLIDDLIGLLCDPRHPISDSACWALGSIGAQAIPRLIAAVHGESSEMRGKAVLALGRYAGDIDLRLPTVLEALDDADAHFGRGSHRLLDLGSADETPNRMGRSVVGILTFHAGGDSTAQIPESIATPDELKSPIGVLQFKDGAPTVETAQRVKDDLTLVRAVNTYNNS